MTLNDLISAFRNRADDTAEPYLWSDAEVKQYLNDAENEAADRARLILDASTAATCQIAAVAGTATYSLHQTILDVRRAKIGDSNPLLKTSVEELDMEWPEWESAKGEPTCYVDAEGVIRLVPEPTENGVLSLSVHRLPLESMVLGADAPEIHARYHTRLIDWALRCAYLKRDSDTHNSEMAEHYELAFNLSFGIKPDANVQRKQRDKRPPVVKANW